MKIAALGALITLPLAGFLINFLLGRKMPEKAVGFIGSAIIFINFIIACMHFNWVLSGDISSSVVNFMDWIHVGNFQIDFSFLVDRLSVMMLLIITGIGFLIHVYSAGYMHGDPGYNRFFAYLNLFIFFMQLLVLGSNYLITFIGWEGVGLCSYLLIGFWYKNQSYNDAAKKAFIMNRIGDLGLLIGIFWIFETFETLNYTEVFGLAANFSGGDTVIVFITLLLFVGAIGKSAQIPLYTWLPDAMAGPTPVSALIHAATMVTAGIYLIVRSHILFELAPLTQEIITVIALATAFFAASIGLAQNDIKKVLAYSTVSQLGFMFVALGLGAYTTAMFHLLTHAFFKALLFLGAGSVIHGMGNDQDIRNMGGLRKKMPLTYITFLVGTLAITGIPPFAGFFSKDEILAKAFEANPVIWVIALAAAVFTAIYMFRLLYLTFHGEFRGTEHQREHLHESPSSMTIPLIVLGILSALGGFLGIPAIFGNAPHFLSEYLAPVFSDMPHSAHDGHALSHTMEWILMGVSTGLVVIVWFVAKGRYTRSSAEGMEDEKQGGLVRLLANKYYVDEAYDHMIVRPLHWLSDKVVYRILETRVVDGIVNGTGRVTAWSGEMVRQMQSGNIGTYVFAMVIGIIVLLLINIRFIF